MHLYKTNKHHINKGMIISVFVFALFFGYFLITTKDVSKDMEKQKINTLSEAINNAVTSCYAVEGFYPSSIDYLVEHYGIVINDEFLVNYESAGSNIKPYINIMYVKE